MSLSETAATVDSVHELKSTLFVQAVPALGAALCAAQAAYDAVRSELAAPATPIPADWSSPIPSAAPLAPSAISLALSALAVATLCIARCLDVVGAAPEPLNEAAAAANTWLTTLRDRRNAVSARVSKSASDVGVLQAQAEPEEVPGVAAAEAAIAVADLLRECTACELALGAGALQHAIQPTAEASGALPSGPESACGRQSAVTRVAPIKQACATRDRAIVALVPQTTFPWQTCMLSHADTHDRLLPAVHPRGRDPACLRHGQCMCTMHGPGSAPLHFRRFICCMAKLGNQRTFGCFDVLFFVAAFPLIETPTRGRKPVELSSLMRGSRVQLAQLMAGELLHGHTNRARPRHLLAGASANAALHWLLALACTVAAPAPVSPGTHTDGQVQAEKARRSPRRSARAPSSSSASAPPTLLVVQPRTRAPPPLTAPLRSRPTLTC